MTALTPEMRALTEMLGIAARLQSDLSQPEKLTTEAWAEVSVRATSLLSADAGAALQVFDEVAPFTAADYDKALKVKQHHPKCPLAPGVDNDWCRCAELAANDGTAPAPARRDEELEAMLMELRLDTVDKQCAETDAERIAAETKQRATMDRIHAHVAQRVAEAEGVTDRELRKAALRVYYAVVGMAAPISRDLEAANQALSPLLFPRAAQPDGAP